MAKDNSGSENFHYNNIEKKIRTLCIRILKEVIAIIATFQIQILTLRLLEEHILKLVVL